MEIIHCAQNSDEWFAAKVGIPSSSQFSAILAGRDSGAFMTRRTYMHKLAGERITGKPAENFRGAAMDRGHAMEAEARSLYEFTNSVTVEQVGFIKNHGAGASPDALVGDDGLLEIKTAAPHVLIGHIEAGKFPTEHFAQVEGQMWVSERQWCDLLIYWPGMAPFQARAARDDDWIDRVLAPDVQRFIDELDDLVARLTGNDAPAVAPATPPVDLSTAPPAF